MDKKLLFYYDGGNVQRFKEIKIFDDPQKFKLILDKLSWRILVLLSEREMYPLEIAKALGVHEQRIYYHIRKLLKAGAITVTRPEEKKGAVAKSYKTTSPAFGVELTKEYAHVKTTAAIKDYGKVQKFFSEFILD
ncbi:MAG: helix-turn-helix domain-containing protein, partial [Candidatus Bathyarchaeia archaeon]